MDRDTRITPLMCLLLSIGVFVAILAFFVYDHDKKLKALDSNENEKLTEIIKGMYYFQYLDMRKFIFTCSILFSSNITIYLWI